MRINVPWNSWRCLRDCCLGFFQGFPRFSARGFRNFWWFWPGDYLAIFDFCPCWSRFVRFLWCGVAAFDPVLLSKKSSETATFPTLFFQNIKQARIKTRIPLTPRINKQRTNQASNQPSKQAISLESPSFPKPQTTPKKKKKKTCQSVPGPWLHSGRKGRLRFLRKCSVCIKRAQQGPRVLLWFLGCCKILLGFCVVLLGVLRFFEDV